MIARATLLVFAMTMTLAGCKHEGAGTTARPGVTSPAIDTLLAAVPGNAVAVGFVDMEVPPWTLITGGAVPLDEATRKTLDTELRQYIDRYLGVDVSKLQHALGFMSGPPMRGALLMTAIGGTLKLPGAMPHEGGTVWAIDPGAHISLALKGDIAVLGDDDAVRDVLDTIAGKRKNALAENRALVDWLHQESQGAAVAFAAIAPGGLPLPPQLAGLQRVAISIGRAGVRAVVDGSDPAISSLQTASDRAFAALLEETGRAHDAAIAGTMSPPEGAFALIGAAYAKSYAAKLKPRRDGNRLSVSLETGLAGAEAMTVVSVIGVLSAVAIPAFMDYMKKSKKSDVLLQLNKLSKNLKTSFAMNGEFPKGQAALTPAAACCTGPGGKCVADPGAWQQPIWQELDFDISGPSLFQYRYRSDGKTAVVEAVGDLDCDTNMITYQLEATAGNGVPSVRITEPSPGSD